MIPFLAQKAIPWRLIGIGVAAIAIGLVLWRVHTWRAGYLERDAAVAERDAAIADKDAYVASVAVRDQQMAKDRADDEARRASLMLTLETARGTIELLRARPIQSVVYRDKPAKDGNCADPRIGPQWFGVYNETADAASRAVSAPN